MFESKKIETMKIPIITIILSLLVCLVSSIKIFPLDNPPPQSAKAPVYVPVGLKKYSGLTAGLWPDATLEPQLPAEPGSVQIPAKDLLPPKVM